MKLLLVLIATIFINCNKSSDPTDSCSGEPTAVTRCTSCFSLATIVDISSGKTVTIDLNDSVLRLSPTCSTYNIMEHPGDINIEYYTYKPHRDSGYVQRCSDMLYPRHLLGQMTTWTAVSGMININVSKATKDRTRFEDYKMSMKLDNVKFVNGNSDTTISFVLKDKLVLGHIP